MEKNCNVVIELHSADPEYSPSLSSAIELDPDTLPRSLPGRDPVLDLDSALVDELRTEVIESTPAPNAKARAAELLGRQPVPRALFSLTWPAFVSMLSLAIYQLIDSMWVGRIAGGEALAALTLGLPVEALMQGVYLVPAVGGACAYGRMLGAGNMGGARRVVGNTVAVGLVLGGLVMCIMTPLVPLVLKLLGASNDANTLAPATSYLRTICAAAVLPTMAMITGNLLRGEGSVMVSCLGALVSAVLNAALDPLWMKLAGAMGAQTVMGAALSSHFAWLANAVIGLLWFVCLRRGAVRPSWRHLRPDWTQISAIVGVGAATFVSQGSQAINMLATNTLVQRYAGDDPSSSAATTRLAAAGSLMRTLSLAYMPIISAAQGMNPITSFCQGAGLKRRFRECQRCTAVWLMPFSVLVTVVLELTAPVLGRIFSDDDFFVTVFRDLMRWAAASIPGYAFCMLFYPCYQAVNRPVVAAFIIAMPSFLCTLPIQVAVALGTGHPDAVAIGIFAGAWLSVIAVSIIVFITRHSIFLGGELPEDPPAPSTAPTRFASPAPAPSESEVESEAHSTVPNRGRSISSVPMSPGSALPPLGVSAVADMGPSSVTIAGADRCDSENSEQMNSFSHRL